ncbi:MAG TPA: ATP-binding protein [Burkholderiaceae bacterium]|jgi:two-component system osmolarity sensor histidine kinase EnvZ
MKRWPLHFPRSLFGRNLLLIVALIFVSEVGIVTLFRQIVQEPRMALLIDFAQTHVEAMRTALDSMAPEQRAHYMAQLNTNQADRILQTRVTLAGQVPASFVEPKRLVVRRFIKRLSERLGKSYQLGWQDMPEQRLWIGTRIDEYDYWFGLQTSVFASANTPLSLLAAIAAGLLSLFGAYLIQRRINRPLHALAAAARHVGEGKRQSLKLDNAPTEIAQVAGSFNQMAAALDAAENERTLMLAGVSHDLRTPLTKLRLATEILADHSEPEIIESMVRNIAAADAVIDQFIDFARLGSDEAERLCDLNELANDIAATSDRSRIKLELGSLVPYQCRPIALRRAVANLVENALRYGHNKDKADDMITLRTTMDAQSISISVLDNGPGIPSEDLERIRQPFTRLDEARSGNPGAGLGLAIVERIAHLHHGELLIKNRANGGLETTLSLPMT